MQVRSKQKLHVTIGHITLMAEATFFGLPDGETSDLETSDAIARRLNRLSLKVSPMRIRYCVKRHLFYIYPYYILLTNALLII